MRDDVGDDLAASPLDPWMMRLALTLAALLLIGGIGVAALTLALLGVVERFVPALKVVAFHHAVFCEAQSGGCDSGDTAAAIIGVVLILSAWLATDPLIDIALSGSDARRQRSRRNRDYL